MNYTVRFDLLVNFLVTAKDEPSAQKIAQDAVAELMECNFSNENVDINDYQWSDGTVFGEGD